MKRKKYRVWRVVIRVFGRYMSIRCLHDTDNLQEVRDRYHRMYQNREAISLHYTEF